MAHLKTGDSIGSLLPQRKRTKDDGLLGGGTVRVDKVDGGIDRGMSRLGKNAIHLDSLFLKNKKLHQLEWAAKTGDLGKDTDEVALRDSDRRAK